MHEALTLGAMSILENSLLRVYIKSKLCGFTDDEERDHFAFFRYRAIRIYIHKR